MRDARTRRLRTVVLTTLSAVGLAACSQTPPVPVDQFYRLPEPAPYEHPGAQTASQRWGTQVFVNIFRGDGLHTERAVVYSEDSAAVALRRYHYHHWVDDPPRLIEDYLTSRLRTLLPNILVLTEPNGRPATVVSGRVRRFDHHVPNEKSFGRALVTLELQLSRGDDRTPLFVKEYRASPDVSGQEMTAAASAFGQAVESIVREFLTDAETALAQER